MKKYGREIYFVVFVFAFPVFSNVAFCSGARISGRDSLPSLVTNLDSRRATIDSHLRGFRKLDLEYSFETDRGGSLVAYLDGQKVRKIIFDVMTSRQDHDYELYCNGHGLISAKVTERSYIWEGGENGDINFGKFQDIQRLFYFKNGKLICWHFTGQKTLHRARDSSFRDFERDVLSASREGRKAVRSGNKAVIR